MANASLNIRAHFAFKVQVSVSLVILKKIMCNATMEKDNQFRIKITTEINYLAEQSDEADNRFVFAYTITITNEGDATVKLISRHWIITDANQYVQEVRGQGVVGEQPVLQPNQSFEYTSGTVLATQVGTMSGSYQMVTEDGTKFDAPIPQFVLSVPRVLH
jgi:ApaG protein